MCPLPPYIKEQGGWGGRPGGGAPGRRPTPIGSRTPSFPCPTRRGGRKGERRGRKGGRCPPPCPIRTRGGGGARPALAAPHLLHIGPIRPITPPGGGSGNPPVLRFYPKLLRNTSGVRI